jgi:hypothetical protein
MKKPALKFALASVLACSLSACLIPEQFESNVNVSKDGNVSFEYVGTMSNPLAMAEEQKNGKLSPKSEQFMRDFGNSMKKETGFRSVDYIGHGKYRVTYQLAGKLVEGHPFRFTGDIPVLTLARKGNEVTLAGISLSQKDMDELGKMHLQFDGTINLKTTNASSTPTLGFGAYSWHIKSPKDPAPRMVIAI